MPKKSLLPFLILGLGFGWAALCEWLRRRSAPGEQATTAAAPGVPNLALVGMAGLLLCMVAAGFAAYFQWMR